MHIHMHDMLVDSMLQLTRPRTTVFLVGVSIVTFDFPSCILVTL